MKKVIFLLGLIILTSCGNSDNVTISKDQYNQLKGIPEQIKPEYPKIIKIHDNWNNPEIKIRLIDGCEYFTYYVSSNAGIMCHKGNCKFCQQRLEQTIRKIIQEELQKK
jgi:hypothetical protein